MSDAPTGQVVRDLAACAPGRYSTVYADPPWSYSNKATRSAAAGEYATMTVEEICALPVVDLAASNSHLHLWTTNAFLEEARTIMEAWGFTYKSCFVWAKPQMGIGNYWRVSHEFLLFGLRGKLPFGSRSLKSWASIPRSRHSRKPDEVRRMIELASPGPRIELFARERFRDWDAWGNEL